MSTWRVLINPKYWDYNKYERNWVEGSTISQSKGRARMVKVPRKGDRVLFVIKGMIKMKGIVVSEGFVQGEEHIEDPYNTLHSIHREVRIFAVVQILQVGLSEPIRFMGQTTWIKLN